MPAGRRAAGLTWRRSCRAGRVLSAWWTSSSHFGEDQLRDLDDDLRAAFRARAVPQPAAVARDPQALTDDRRYDVPATIIACELPSEQVRQWIAEGDPYVAELAAMRDVEYVDLPTGHWPQFTRPQQLAQAILAAISGRSVKP